MEAMTSMSPKSHFITVVMKKASVMITARVQKTTTIDSKMLRVKSNIHMNASKHRISILVAMLPSSAWYDSTLTHTSET